MGSDVVSGNGQRGNASTLAGSKGPNAQDACKQQLLYPYSIRFRGSCQSMRLFRAANATHPRGTAEQDCSETEIAKMPEKQPGGKADGSAGGDAADRQDRQIVCNLAGLRPETGGDDLPDVVEHPTGDTDTERREQRRFFQQNHAGQADRGPGSAEHEALQIAEQQGRQQYPNQADGGGLLPAAPVQQKDDHKVWKAELHAGDGGKDRNLAFHKGQNHGQGNGQPQKCDGFCLHDSLLTGIADPRRRFGGRKP